MQGLSAYWIQAQTAVVKIRRSSLLVRIIAGELFKKCRIAPGTSGPGVVVSVQESCGLPSRWNPCSPVSMSTMYRINWRAFEMTWSEWSTQCNESESSRISPTRIDSQQH